MKKAMAVAAFMAGVIASATAQEITIKSISGNGSMSFWGAQVGTTATVEWAASLTDAGRTNWHNLTNVVVTDYIMTNDIPMFFRVRGILEATNINGWVKWPVANGGNGHWYKVVRSTGSISWSTSSGMAAADYGGYLATVTSTQEDSFVFSLVKPSDIGPDTSGPWLGGRQTDGAPEPNGGWYWITGESWSYTNWRAGEPNNSLGNENSLHYHAYGGWNDYADANPDVVSFIVERNTTP